MAHLQSREMNNAVNFWVFFEDFVKSLLICDVDIIVCRLLSTDTFDTVENIFERIVEIIDDDDFVVGLEECKCSERTNVASATVCLLVSACLKAEETYPVIRQ